MSPRIGFFRRFRHAQLLAALALLLFLRPFVARGDVGSIVLNLLTLVTLLSAVIACSKHRGQLVVGLGLTVLLQGAAWYREVHEMAAISVAYSLLGLVFFAYVGFLVLADVFRARSVSVDTICGALSVYLFLGIWWAFAYAALEEFAPGSILGIRQSGGGGGYAQYLGYSFVTLTTLGYGNVVPGNGRADMLAVGEAVVGQIYMTVLVARLVALNLTGGGVGRDELDD